VNPPEPGHAWLTGLLLTGCFTADDELIDAARTMATGLANHPARAQGRDDRARDLGWPLLELEAWLRFADDHGCGRRADQLGQDLLARWDPRNGVLRFGEGEVERDRYLERAWLTGGILLPALRAHLRRRPERRDLAQVVHQLEHRLSALVAQGRAGLPVRYWVRAGEVEGQVRLTDVPEGALLLEGLPAAAAGAVLERRAVQKALDGVLSAHDPDLATTWSMVARCEWVLR
jgi:hypothetical protein